MSMWLIPSRQSPRTLRFHDGAPIPAPRPFLRTEYVDNFAKNTARQVESALNARGLPTHEVEEAVGGETSGWHFSSSPVQVTVTPRRLWKLRLATCELISQGWATGQLVETVVGHLTFTALLRRELLSFSGNRVHCRLWPQVVRELRRACSLLPLVSRNIARGFVEVFATDASHWGRRVAKMTSTLDAVRAQGRVRDRWRFTRTYGVQHVYQVRHGTTSTDRITLKLTPSCILSMTCQKGLCSTSCFCSFSLTKLREFG